MPVVTAEVPKNWSTGTCTAIEEHLLGTSRTGTVQVAIARHTFRAIGRVLTGAGSRLAEFGIRPQSLIVLMAALWGGSYLFLRLSVPDFGQCR